MEQGRFIRQVYVGYYKEDGGGLGLKEKQFLIFFFSFYYFFFLFFLCNTGGTIAGITRCMRFIVVDPENRKTTHGDGMKTKGAIILL